MTQIVVRAEIADRIRMSEGPVELVDEQGVRVGIVRRPPTSREIEIAKTRMGKPGPKFTVEELIAKVEAS